MPLKHFTETFLIVVLGAVIALTGLLIASLPALPGGALPWAVLFVLSIVYPLALHSLFQKRRADNFFRKLHWFPALMLLIWMLLQGIAVYGTVDGKIVGLYAWGWTLGAVVVGFLLIVLFSLKVIRRRVPRIAFLALILVPFTTGAIFSQQEARWENELAVVLWSADFWKAGQSGLVARLVDNETPEVVTEDQKKEMAWREKLALQERRQERIAARMKEERSSASNGSSVEKMPDPDTMVAQKREETAKMMAERKPETLPTSGFGWGAIVLTLVGAYCATLHSRMRKVKTVRV